MGEPVEDMVDRAHRLGAVALVTLRRPDLIAAEAEHSSDRPVGNIVCFPKRARADPPAPAVYEDPRWADRHRPD